jgi:membrane protein DedA with SNARE-associated domain
LPLEFFYLDSISSFFGGSTVYYLGVYSYGTTVTKPKERAHRLARLDGVETLANIIGTLLSPFVFQKLGYFGNYGIRCQCYKTFYVCNLQIECLT